MVIVSPVFGLRPWRSWRIVVLNTPICTNDTSLPADSLLVMVSVNAANTLFTSTCDTPDCSDRVFNSSVLVIVVLVVVVVVVKMVPSDKNRTVRIAGYEPGAFANMLQGR